jgi:DNA topoisomerase-3
MIYDTVDCSIRSLLNPKLTASWELGLTRVAEGTVTEEEYLEKLNGFVTRNTNNVKNSNWGGALQAMYMRDSQYYHKPTGQTRYPRKKTGKKGAANASE